MTTPSPPPPPPPLPQQPTPQPKKRGCLRAFLIICGVLVGLFILLLIIGALLGPSGSKPTSSSASISSSPEGPPISWEEVNSIYNLQSKNTNLQKDEQWKRFKGKRVVWSGIVSGVSDDWTGFSLQVKMNPDTLTYDLFVHLNQSEKPKAAQLHEGDTVRFSGRLENWGTVLPITLDDGQILE